jgi:hypothetical protein
VDSKIQLLLVEICPYVDEEDEDEEDTPAHKGTDSAREALLVEEEANGKRAEDLGDPVHEIV